MNSNSKNMKKITILLSALFIFTSCEEKIYYDWGDINESLGELQNARIELQSEMSEMESEGYDTSGLQDIDNRLKKVERILDEKFQ